MTDADGEGIIEGLEHVALGDHDVRAIPGDGEVTIRVEKPGGIAAEVSIPAEYGAFFAAEVAAAASASTDQ